jgi:SET domain
MASLVLSIERSVTDVGNDDGHDDASVERDNKATAPPVCGLYMAESTIPKAGWGVFTGMDAKRGHDFGADAAIIVTDFPRGGDASSALSEYWWADYLTRASFDASRVASVLPGIGMMSNSHPGYVNVRNRGVSDRVRIGRGNASFGAFSHAIGHSFDAAHALEAGQELFSEYGDEWFAYRYPNVPRKADYEEVNNLLSGWKQRVEDDGIEELTSDRAEALYLELALGKFKDSANETLDADLARQQVLVPTTVEEAARAIRHKRRVAGLTLENHRRSLDWLYEHGACLDHLEAQPSTVEPHQMGAVLRSDRGVIRQGQLVAPVPVVAVARSHTRLNGTTEHRQLILNYCYGHVDSSVLLFPYSPVVNFVNHGFNGTANVRIRWSSMSNDKKRLWTASRLLQSGKSQGLVLELFALRDLHPGEEVLLDYGDRWSTAWRKHEHDWRIQQQNRGPGDSESQATMAWYEYERNYAMPPLSDGGTLLVPTSMQSRCYVDVDRIRNVSAVEGPWLPHSQYAPIGDLFNVQLETLPCDVVGADSEEDGLYRAIVRDEDGRFITNLNKVPKNAILIMDRPYQTPQLLRGAFRHEIGLPDDVFPDAWKDLASPTCSRVIGDSALSRSNRVSSQETK